MRISKKENLNFDFVSFSIQLIKSIDSMRSTGKSNSNSKESRINAFYRAIGFPETVSVIINKDENSITEEDIAEALWAMGSKEQDINNGNFFKKIQLSEKDFDVLFKRELDKTKQNEQDEIKRLNSLFLDNNESKISDAITGARGRQKILPTVCSSIPIYPRSKKIGPAFAPESRLKNDKVILKRPLLEMIISMKLKQINATASGFDDQIYKNFSILGELIINELDSSLYNIRSHWLDTKEKCDKIRKYLSSVREGEQNIPTQNVPLKTDLDKNKSELEKKMKEQQNVIEKRRSVSALLSFNDTFNKSKTRNVKDAALASNLIDLVMSEELIQKSIKEVSGIVEKKEIELKEIYRDLDLILGVFYGLSGVDMMLIIISLFRCDKDVLISLLNNESYEYFKQTTGLEITRIPIEEALKKVEEAIKKEYENLEGILK